VLLRSRHRRNQVWGAKSLQEAARALMLGAASGEAARSVMLGVALRGSVWGRVRGRTHRGSVNGGFGGSVGISGGGNLGSVAREM